VLGLEQARLLAARQGHAPSPRLPRPTPTIILTPLPGTPESFETLIQEGRFVSSGLYHKAHRQGLIPAPVKTGACPRSNRLKAGYSHHNQPASAGLFYPSLGIYSQAN
jgi:hypothetical protein